MNRVVQGRKLTLLALVSVLLNSSISMPLKFPSLLLSSVALAQSPSDRQREADRLLQQGQQYLNRDRLQEAIQSFEQALTLYRQLQNRRGEGQALKELGNAYYWSSNYPQALTYGQQALAIARTLGDRDLEWRVLNNIGLVYFWQENYPQALEVYQQSLAIARAIPAREGEGLVLRNLGDVYYWTKNYEQAATVLQEGLAIARKLQQRPLEATLLIALGKTHAALGESERAIDSDRQALAIVRELNNRPGEADVLNSLVLVYLDLKNYPAALEAARESLTLAQELQDRARMSTALGLLSDAFFSQGRYPDAIAVREQQLAIVRDLQDLPQQADTLLGLGMAAQNLGDYLQAIDYFEQARAIARAIPNAKRVGQALTSLGDIHISLGEFAKAIAYYDQRLQLARTARNREEIFAALQDLGGIYAYLDESTEALAAYQESLAIARELNDKSLQMKALNHLAAFSKNFGNFPEAANSASQGLALARELGDRWGEWQALFVLGSAYRNLRDPRALENLEQALALSQEIQGVPLPLQAIALSGLGLAYASFGDFARAIEMYQQSVAIARQIQDLEMTGRALDSLGLAFFQAGKLAEAENALGEAAIAWESLRRKLGPNDLLKVSMFEVQADTYSQLQVVLVARDKSNEALEIAERGRARAFVELLAARLASAEAQQPAIQPPTLDEIQKIAREENATLIEYSLLPYVNQLYIWAVKPTGEIAFRQVDLQPLSQQNIALDDLVTRSRRSLGVGGRGLVEVRPAPDADRLNRLQQLYQLLIDPIADLLPTDQSDRVIFIPQGSLFLVPFAALQDRQGKYLIENHTILTAPAIQVLDLTRQQREALGNQESGVGEVLIVGNPTMPKVATRIGETPQQLPSLPGAEQEALAIAQLFNIQAMTGSQATETAVIRQMPNARIVHLATHGLLDDLGGQGIPGAIALAPSEGDAGIRGKLGDGLLTSGEILDLKLKAELVVLSACNTGQGRITGDGVIGLSRSLISAGVPSVLVSLWQVPDAPTAELMTAFYQNLQNNPDKARALRQAMLATMKQHPNPRDWAAFTLIGEAF
jgi:CHAT domain-containing protein